MPKRKLFSVRERVSDAGRPRALTTKSRSGSA
jgi:hypothetical protein